MASQLYVIIYQIQGYTISLRLTVYFCISYFSSYYNFALGKLRQLKDGRDENNIWNFDR